MTGAGTVLDERLLLKLHGEFYGLVASLMGARVLRLGTRRQRAAAYSASLGMILIAEGSIRNGWPTASFDTRTTRGIRYLAEQLHVDRPFLDGDHEFDSMRLMAFDTYERFVLTELASWSGWERSADYYFDDYELEALIQTVQNIRHEGFVIPPPGSGADAWAVRSTFLGRMATEKFAKKAGVEIEEVTLLRLNTKRLRDEIWNRVVGTIAHEAGWEMAC
jgi:hypothetical protein